MTDTTEHKMSTRSVHVGERRDAERAVHAPLYNHSTFTFDSTTGLLDIGEGREPGNLHTRRGLAPTIRSTEAKLADLEGGEQALASPPTWPRSSWCSPGLPWPRSRP